MTYKEIGTLAEIGASVGDVVEMVSITSGYNLPEVPLNIESDGWPVHPNGKSYDPNFDNHYNRRYRIVSRASDITPDEYARYPSVWGGPVITERITTKRIVPGVYGKVEVVATSDDGHVWVCMKETSAMSRPDLIAARDVFNQLIDAMGDE